MALERLADCGVLVEQHLSEPDAAVSSISYNSKTVQAGTLFVCKGINFKDSYLDEALSRGAGCYISEEVRYPEKSADYILVSDIRIALAVLAAWFFDYGESSPRLIGVTGTKGKSTVIYLLKNILGAAGVKCGYMTTVDVFDGETAAESKLTTPESLELFEIISRAGKNGCQWVIVELSSQSEKMHRIYGLEIEYGVFVNISDDHISPNEHHSFEEYMLCKENIVAMYKNAVINLDDPHSDDFIAAADSGKSTEISTYSISSEEADYHASCIIPDGFRSLFTLNTPDSSFECEISIPGQFNVSNALAAAAVADMLGIGQREICEGIYATQIPGRMNIYEKDGYIAVVDYAHNRNSMTAALGALREYYPERNIVVVFGCPGGKALQRRRDMAQISGRYASFVYVTSEDPAYEDPHKIAREVKSYLEEFSTPSEIILDRESAVKEAVKRLRKNEILLIAGKGSEHYQMIGGVAAPYGADTELTKKFMTEK